LIYAFAIEQQRIDTTRKDVHVPEIKITMSMLYSKQSNAQALTLFAAAAAPTAAIIKTALRCMMVLRSKYSQLYCVL
jgi:hypothetical protein